MSDNTTDNTPINRETLKSYFQSGVRPTEKNFEDLIDALLVKEGDTVLVPKDYMLDLKGPIMYSSTEESGEILFGPPVLNSQDPNDPDNCDGFIIRYSDKFFKDNTPFIENMLLKGEKSSKTGKLVKDIKFFKDDKLFEDDKDAFKWSDALVFEKKDVNNETPQGGIAFANTGSDQKRKTAMVIRGNGSVGIGTENPDKNTLLHITSNKSGTTNLRLEAGVENENADYIPMLRILRDKGKTGVNMGFIMPENSDGNVAFSISSRHNGANSIKKAFVIDTKHGNVGIGNKPTSGEPALDVFGAIKCPGLGLGTILYGRTNVAGTPIGDGFRIRYDTRFFNQPTDQPTRFRDALIFEKTDGNTPVSDGGIAFVNTGNDGVQKLSMAIRGTGNVGIGTPDPKSRLEVGVPHEAGQDEEMRIGSYWQGNFYGLGFNYSIDDNGNLFRHLVEHNGTSRYNAMTFRDGKIDIGIGTDTSKVRLQIMGGSDVEKAKADTGFLIIGDSNNKHIAIDDNEIMAKKNGTGAGTLHLQNEGGTTKLGGNVIIGAGESKVKLHIKGGSGVEKATADTGFMIIGDSNDDHIAIDNNKIMAKKNGIEAGSLLLQNEGGITYMGGDVGIGTTSPKVKLHITGGTAVARNSKNSGYLFIGNSDTGKSETETGPTHIAVDNNSIRAQSYYNALKEPVTEEEKDITDLDVMVSRTAADSMKTVLNAKLEEVGSGAAISKGTEKSIEDIINAQIKSGVPVSMIAKLTSDQIKALINAQLKEDIPGAKMPKAASDQIEPLIDMQIKEYVPVAVASKVTSDQVKSIMDTQFEAYIPGTKTPKVTSDQVTKFIDTQFKGYSPVAMASKDASSQITTFLGKELKAYVPAAKIPKAKSNQIKKVINTQLKEFGPVAMISKIVSTQIKVIVEPQLQKIDNAAAISTATLDEITGIINVKLEENNFDTEAQQATVNHISEAITSQLKKDKSAATVSDAIKDQIKEVIHTKFEEVDLIKQQVKTYDKAEPLYLQSNGGDLIAGGDVYISGKLSTQNKRIQRDFFVWYGQSGASIPDAEDDKPGKSIVDVNIGTKADILKEIKAGEANVVTGTKADILGAVKAGEAGFEAKVVEVFDAKSDYSGPKAAYTEPPKSMDKAKPYTRASKAIKTVFEKDNSNAFTKAPEEEEPGGNGGSGGTPSKGGKGGSGKSTPKKGQKKKTTTTKGTQKAGTKATAPKGKKPEPDVMINPNEIDDIETDNGGSGPGLQDYVDMGETDPWPKEEEKPQGSPIPQENGNGTNGGNGGSLPEPEKPPQEYVSNADDDTFTDFQEGIAIPAKPKPGKETAEESEESEVPPEVVNVGDQELGVVTDFPGGIGEIQYEPDKPGQLKNYVHIKTNLKKGSDMMYRILAEGYNPEMSSPINSEVVGYTVSGSGRGIANSSATDHALGASISQYYSDDDYVVIVLGTEKVSHIGFSLSAWIYNQEGAGISMHGQIISHGQDDDIYYEDFDEFPIFPGCEDDLMSDEITNKEACFIAKIEKFIHAHFSSEIASMNIEGTVNVTFSIDKTGIITGIQPEGYTIPPDIEAMIIEQLPEMTIPGKRQGEAVNVRFTVPINFSQEPDPGEDNTYYEEDQFNVFPVVSGCGNVAAVERKNCFAAKTEDFLYTNYSSEITSMNIEGVVGVIFSIDKTTRITNIEIDGYPAIPGAIKQSIIEAFPDIISPGKIGKTAVNVRFTVLIDFSRPDPDPGEDNTYYEEDQFNVFPVFPGCENVPAGKIEDCFILGMSNFIDREFGPQIEFMNIQGPVNMTFTIDKAGNVTSIKPEDGSGVLKGMRDAIIEKLPKMAAPGKIGTTAVNVRFTVPIYFNLK